MKKNVEEISIQEQVNEINRKLDLVLEYVNHQRLKTIMIEDLVTDISIVGKDMYDSAVAELDKQAVEIDPDEVRILFIRLLKNINTFHVLVDILEGTNDFIKDILPIVNELFIDFSKKLNEFEQKGYFSFINNSVKMVETIITQSSDEDMEQLSANIPELLAIIRKLSQPRFIKALKNFTEGIEKTMDTEIPQYSIFRMLREMQKPEMRKAMGFLATLNKNILDNHKS